MSREWSIVNGEWRMVNGEWAKFNYQFVKNDRIAPGFNPVQIKISMNPEGVKYLASDQQKSEIINELLQS